MQMKRFYSAAGEVVLRTSAEMWDYSELRRVDSDAAVGREESGNSIKSLSLIATRASCTRCRGKKLKP